VRLGEWVHWPRLRTAAVRGGFEREFRGGTKGSLHDALGGMRVIGYREIYDIILVSISMGREG
jgi:hypothetical protein